jgi:hypothetical protein
MPKMRTPRPDPSLIAAQEAQKRAEAERASELKRKQLEKTKAAAAGGIRSLISSAGGGFGRNFFG